MILMLCLSGAAEYAFGSKVALGDTDVQRLIYDFDDIPVPKYWNIGPVGYDAGDPVYLDIIRPGDDLVQANDLRLTAFNTFAAGTKVIAGDSDLDMPLTDLTDWAIVYTDLYGTVGAYDIRDPVYISNSSPAPYEILTNDIRLNRVNTLMAGTKVLDYHPDHEKGASLLIHTFRFYNVNGNQNAAGNPIYDFEDDVYLDISLPFNPIFGFVAVNDVRLTEV